MLLYQIKAIDAVDKYTTYSNAFAIRVPLLAFVPPFIRRPGAGCFEMLGLRKEVL